jgi:hypothetical protein
MNKLIITVMALVLVGSTADMFARTKKPHRRHYTRHVRYERPVRYLSPVYAMPPALIAEPVLYAPFAAAHVAGHIVQHVVAPIARPCFFGIGAAVNVLPGFGFQFYL